MPGGVPWSTYLKMLSSSLLVMCARAQVVPWYYLPDLTIPEIPPKPGELKTELLGLKEKHTTNLRFYSISQETEYLQCLQPL
uniref:Uncharacterized protein n=1 Tax=Cricetulus griseus TaxID=10029 RepID=A0A8C2LPB5_CRIGR